MKILVDIGHAAHVHLFKNMAHDLIIKGHFFHFTVREGEHETALLDYYGFSYTVIGKKQKGIVWKVLGLIFFSYKIFRVARIFKPDLFLSHGSMYAGYAAFLTGKKHIALEDTGNMEQLLFSKPVSDVILSPRSLQVDLGKKHIRYNGFHELAYLHPKRFKPDISVLDELKIKGGEPFVILRFISWNASHDLGRSGLKHKEKLKLVEELAKLATIFISGEKSLPAEFVRYALKIPTHRLHDALFYASLYVGEGATTASECAMLGTPGIYVSSVFPGTLLEQQRYGLTFCLNEFSSILEKANQILSNSGIKHEFIRRRNMMLEDNIDVTSLLTWFVENYPESKSIMISDPSFQLNFKK